MSSDYRDIRQDDKRQADLSTWRRSWSPVVTRDAAPAEARSKSTEVTPIQASEALRAIVYSMPPLLVRSLESGAVSTNRVTAAAAYAEMGE